MDEATKKEWQAVTTRLIIAIGKQLCMEENDQILMMMLLNTPEKVKRFSDWAGERTVKNRIISTPEAVMHAVAQINRGDEVLD